MARIEIPDGSAALAQEYREKLMMRLRRLRSLMERPRRGRDLPQRDRRRAQEGTTRPRSSPSSAAATANLGTTRLLDAIGRDCPPVKHALCSRRRPSSRRADEPLFAYVFKTRRTLAGRIT